jgi:hypothetical protein
LGSFLLVKQKEVDVEDLMIEKNKRPYCIGIPVGQDAINGHVAYIGSLSVC